MKKKKNPISQDEVELVGCCLIAVITGIVFISFLITIYIILNLL